MQTTKKNLTDTKLELVLTADDEQLQTTKQKVLEKLSQDVRLPGFRKGKAPLALIEKNINPSEMQTEFLDHIINLLYVQAIREHMIRPVAQPAVKINKFVPFTTLEVTVEVEVVGTIKLPDYKKIRMDKTPVTVTAKDVKDVIGQLTKREVEKKDVTRAAKDGDEVTLDFKGVDAKTEEPIAGAEGKDQPLVLGSNTFIPGFETNLIGLKSGEKKTFTLTFPKDYGVATLQNKKVTFSVDVTKVQQLVEPKVDDAFAAKIGPFKTVAELEADIKKQLKSEKESQAERQYTDDLLTKITKETETSIPEVLVTEQIERLIDEQRRNLVYRGMTWPEFLASQNVTEEQYREQVRPEAELRVKAGLVLGEVADKEQITVTPEELDIRMQVLQAQYPDQQMQEELKKPEARNEIFSRMISEKTAAKLVEYASKK